VCFLFGFPCVSTFFKTLDCRILGFGSVGLCCCCCCCVLLFIVFCCSSSSFSFFSPFCFCVFKNIYINKFSCFGVDCGWIVFYVHH